MKKNKISASELTLGAMLTAIALIFSYVEALVPFSIGIPGIKAGFANIVILYALYKLGDRYGLIINVCRICLSALLFGSLFSMLYSLAGGLVSFAAMVLFKRCRIFSTTGVSMAGGVFHNFGQILVAAFVVKTPQIIYYFPVLIFAGIITGIINGIIATLCLKRF